MKTLLAVGFALLLPAAASAQGPITFTTGWRGPAGPSSNQYRAGPLFSVDIQPLRWSWGSAGFELSHAPRRDRTDSSAVNPPEGCYGPDQVLTTCAFRRSITGEATSQIGTLARFGPQSGTLRPFAELALGYSRTVGRARFDVWDPSGRHLTNLSGDGGSSDDGIYGRVGAGLRFQPWSSGPAFQVSGRYRWAKRGIGIDDWTEWFNERKGWEVAVGVVLRP